MEALKILAGFVLALVLFYVQEKWRMHLMHNQTRVYCLKEVRHNIALFEKLIETTQRVRQEVAVGKQLLYFDFQPDTVLYKFTVDAYAQGILFDRLEAEEIAKYNSELSFFGQNLLTYVTSKITGYQAGQIPPQDMLGTMQWVEDKAKRKPSRR